MLKGIGAMINVQRMLKDMKKIAEETNTTILMASVNNRIMNVTNITQISEDLWYLIQSDMDNRAFQIQWILANELECYKGKNNKYVDDNIKEI